MTGLLMAVLTGSTCGDACWHAREEICRCSCGGINHGILNAGGNRPKRTCRIAGEFYELVAVIPGIQPGECGIDAINRTSAAVSEVIVSRFPGMCSWGYGEYRLARTMPVVDRKISSSQMKWPEVQAVTGAYRLVWARPEGSRYVVRTEDGFKWNDAGDMRSKVYSAIQNASESLA